jgi:SAM-dependent methyltransferase
VNAESAREPVSEHYRAEGLFDRIKTALGRAGLAGRRIDPADLAGLDQFHVGGLPATAELAALCDLRGETRVLDLGSGLGGPARHLAATHGCRVEGIDLSAAFVEAANYLSTCTGLEQRVTCRQGDACRLPFADASVDVVWTQHAAMNIADRAGLYAEAARVLRPGGVIALHDVVKGNGEPVIFPVPWARESAGSFLLSAQETRHLLTNREVFHVTSWRDRTTEGLDWLEARLAAAPAAAAPTLTLKLVMGPDFGLMLENLARNLREGRLGLLQAVLRRGA